MSTNEEMVNGLVGATGCDQNLAGMLLKFTGWDMEGAKRIIEAVPKDIFAIKVKFITQITGYYGAFFFCYDEKEGKIKRIIAIITDDKEIGRINLETRWRDFEEGLYDYARNKRVEGLKIEQLKELLIDQEFLSKLSNILKVEKPVKNEIVNNLLVDELYNIFADTNIAVKFHIEMTDAFELNKGKEVAQVGEGSEDDLNPEEVDSALESRKQERPDQSLVVLRVDPVLSPVSGIGIRDLEFGDEIQVRITDERDIADYLAELLGGKVDSIRVPVFTKIIEVKNLEGGNVGVFTQFGPGIVGMFKVHEDVKIISKREPGVEPAPVQKSKKELNPLIVIGGIVVVIIVFMVLIFLSR